MFQGLLAGIVDVEVLKAFSSSSSQDYHTDTELLDGKASKIKQPRYKRLNAEENAIVSIPLLNAQNTISIVIQLISSVVL